MLFRYKTGKCSSTKRHQIVRTLKLSSYSNHFFHYFFPSIPIVAMGINGDYFPVIFRVCLKTELALYMQMKNTSHRQLIGLSFSNYTKFRSKYRTTILEKSYLRYSSKTMEQIAFKKQISAKNMEQNLNKNSIIITERC